MPAEKASGVAPTAAAEPVADAAADTAVFDEFAGQATNTAVWSEAVKAQLPKKSVKA
jgi:hypothetical protein